MEDDGQPKSVISLPKSHSDELVVLRTRVTQQSELIAMLKTRADSTLLEVMPMFSSCPAHVCYSSSHGLP